jgi:AcrR family transcriptional regulator
MARTRTIDLNLIMDTAEQLLSESGGVYFTLDQVAARAGISKGAITNAYASKTELVNALLTREFTRFRQEREAYQDGSKDRFSLVRAHIKASGKVNHTYETRASHLIAALAHEQAHLDTIRSLYSNLLEDLAGDDPLARMGRLALFAIEGAFLMRGLGIVTISDDDWQQLFTDALDIFSSDKSSLA